HLSAHACRRFLPVRTNARFKTSRVQLLSAFALHDAENFFNGHGVPIRPSCSQGVINIRDDKNPRRQGKLFGSVTAKISGAVEFFVVRSSDFTELPESRNSPQDFEGEIGMFFDHRKLTLRKLAGLFEN